MSWLKKLLPNKLTAKISQPHKTIPEGLWAKCQDCQTVLYHTELKQSFQVCPKCHFHHRMPARARLNWLFDNGLWQELGCDVKPIDRLKFKDSKRYKDRLTQAQSATGETDSLLAGRGTLSGKTIVAAAFEFNFMGGSMGAVLGEKFVRGAQAALAAKAPYICFTASGGARMQEGLISLMQMAKTSAALAQLDEAGLPFISVLTDPTMGGVSASLAMLGDVILAEPKSLIGFAGPRVIEQTVRQKLPEGFQRSEFLLEHGAIDDIVDRRHMRTYLTQLLDKLHP